MLCIQYNEATGMIEGTVMDSLSHQRRPIPADGRGHLYVPPGTQWEGMKVDLNTLQLVPIPAE